MEASTLGDVPFVEKITLLFFFFFPLKGEEVANNRAALGTKTGTRL